MIERPELFRLERCRRRQRHNEEVSLGHQPGLRLELIEAVAQRDGPDVLLREPRQRAVITIAVPLFRGRSRNVAAPIDIAPAAEEQRQKENERAKRTGQCNQLLLHEDTTRGLEVPTCEPGRCVSPPAAMRSSNLRPAVDNRLDIFRRNLGLREPHAFASQEPGPPGLHGRAHPAAARRASTLER